MSEVDETEDVGTDGNGRDGQVREKKGDEVESEVVLDGGTISVIVTIFLVLGLRLGLGVVVIEESEELLGGVTEGKSGDPGTDSDDASEGEVFVSLNDGNSLTSGFHGLVSLPEEGTLDVSDDGDGKGPGEEKNNGEELPESEEITSVGGTRVGVVESSEEVDGGLNGLNSSVGSCELGGDQSDEVTGVGEELWSPLSHGWVRGG